MLRRLLKGRLSLPARSSGQRKSLIAFGAVVVVAGVVVFVTRPGTSSQLAKDCPSEALVTRSLNQTVKTSTSAELSYGDYKAANNSGNEGTRLTCTYKTKKGNTIQFILSSNAHPEAIIAAEEAGFGATQTFSGGAGFEHVKKVPKVVGAFGVAKIAWTLANGQILDALYGDDTNLLIIAPGASKTQLENLAKNTQGVPLTNMRVNHAT